MSKPLELSGQRFGKLTVLCRELNNAKGRTRWRCACDCGGEIVASGSNLQQGFTAACGCVRRTKAATNARARNFKHGAAARSGQTSEYVSWSSMWARCTYPCVHSSELYLGRGVTVCERWGTFETFLADMGLKPTPKHTIDRYPNSGGNYEPGNCRWATRSEQEANKRKRLERDGDYPEDQP
jgi:hypothetical protein